MSNPPRTAAANACSGPTSPILTIGSQLRINAWSKTDMMECIVNLCETPNHPTSNTGIFAIITNNPRKLGPKSTPNHTNAASLTSCANPGTPPV